MSGWIRRSWPQCGGASKLGLQDYLDAVAARKQLIATVQPPVPAL